jgi:hypothetical protein
LAITLDYSFPGVLRVNITAYVKSMIKEFPEKLDGSGKFTYREAVQSGCRIQEAKARPSSPDSGQASLRFYILCGK